MTTQQTNNFIRYLAAKQTVDDRALNRNVWNTLNASLPPATPDRPLRVLEVGAGIGTMIERLATRHRLSNAIYTAIDSDPDNIAEANRLLPIWGAAQELKVAQLAPGLSPMRRTRLHREGAGASQTTDIVVETEIADVFGFVEREHGRREWDLLIANAFLDLLDIPSALPRLFAALRPGGLFYFTINFDGVTTFEPAIDPAFDEEIERLYHQTMDERLTAGRPSGDSRSGRHLFHHLRRAGARILDAGSSDWVVYADGRNYPADEAYFLHFIVDTLRGALHEHPHLSTRREQFAAWIDERHRQIDDGRMVYIAHQLDFVGQWPGSRADRAV